MPDTGTAAERRAPADLTAKPVSPAGRSAELGPAGGRLAVLLAAVLLLLGSAFVSITWHDYEATLEDGWAAVDRAALGAAEHAGRSIGAARMVTDRVGATIRREGPRAFRGSGQPELAAMLRDLPQIGALQVLGPDGVVASSSQDPEPPPIRVFPREDPALPDRADSALAPLRLDRMTPSWSFAFLRPVRDTEGYMVGLVLAALRADEFLRFQRGLGLGAGGRVALFRMPDGAPLMVSPLPRTADAQGLPLDVALMPPAEVLRIAASGQMREGRFGWTGPGGAEYLVAWRLSGPLMAAAGMPRSAALAPFHGRLLRNALLFGLAAAVVVALAGAVATALARGGRIRLAAEAGERQLAAVLEATGDGVIAVDASWRISFVNRRAAAALAAGRELRGLVFWDAFPEAAGTAFAGAYRRTMEQRLPAVVEAAWPALGRRFRAESHAREDGGIVIFFRDVTQEREAASRIAESEARFRAMADNIPQLAWMARPDGWIFWFNRRWFDYTGTTLAEVEGQGWRRVHHPEHVEHVTARLARAWEGGHPWEDTFPLRGKDGGYRWFLSRAMPVLDGEGRIALWFGTHTDVTEQRAAQAALRESEAHLRRVLDNLFVFVAVLSPSGTLLEVNRAPLEAAGLTLADVRGKPFWDCPWWSYDAAVQARLRELCRRAAAGEAVRYDVEARMAGDLRWTLDFQIAPLRDAEGRVTHLIPSGSDVTKRREAEAALAESEARFRLAQEAAEIGIFERMLPSPYAHWSATMFRLYGIDPGDRSPWMHETEHLALLHPDDRAIHHARRDAMRSDPAQAHFSFEFRIRRADTGEVRWLSTRGEVVRDETGRPAVIRGVNYDVTERRRAEERLLLLAREVDHRAKNALAVVQAIVGLTRHSDPEQFRAAVTGRIASMARAHTLLAREGWGSAELRELVEAEVAPHRSATQEGVERVAIAGPAAALAPGAAQPLAMALHELATNAAKYGALATPVGQVMIAWEAADDGGLLLRWTEAGGPRLDGPPERRGFGSSVIRNTVERQLGGRVRFDWPPEGLACTLTLPASQIRWPRSAGRDVGLAG
ncbi:PAS domain S-box protein [Roseomonas sp. AR75]|uniref:PAS domain S-box protein n=1 Tax=Roseomonas sp. AR75 TaxID=2562311 RepID=UPI0010BFDA06|nr:PAS domain S-box protein [Roseomonas sp. AR75]